MPNFNASKTHCKNGHEFTPENTEVRVTSKGTTRRCKVCRNAYALKLYHDRGGAEADWEKHLRKDYGPEAPTVYKRLNEAQGGVCAICLGTCVDRNRLCYDHDHQTDEPRGLLCFQCNVALGGFADRLDLLEAAAEYLRNPPARNLAVRRS